MMKTNARTTINKRNSVLLFSMFFLVAAIVSWVPCAQAQGSDAKSILKAM